MRISWNGGLDGQELGWAGWGFRVPHSDRSVARRDACSNHCRHPDGGEFLCGFAKTYSKRIGTSQGFRCRAGRGSTKRCHSKRSRDPGRAVLLLWTAFLSATLLSADVPAANLRLTGLLPSRLLSTAVSSVPPPPSPSPSPSAAARAPSPPSQSISALRVLDAAAQNSKPQRCDTSLRHRPIEHDLGPRKSRTPNSFSKSTVVGATMDAGSDDQADPVISRRVRTMET